MRLISRNHESLVANGSHSNIEKIKITAYEPAYGIIGDPAKMSPTTRQSADHSMAYIIATLIRKATEKHEAIKEDASLESIWKNLMLGPTDYGHQALWDQNTRDIM